MNPLTILIVVIIAFILGRVSARYYPTAGAGVTPIKSRTDDELDDMRASARDALQERTEDRKKRIIEMMQKEEQHDKELTGCNIDEGDKGVTCSDVEKLLDVSTQTALKYLDELEAENKIEQIGTVGRGVYYVLK